MGPAEARRPPHQTAETRCGPPLFSTTETARRFVEAVQMCRDGVQPSRLPALLTALPPLDHHKLGGRSGRDFRCHTNKYQPGSAGGIDDVFGAGSVTNKPHVVGEILEESHAYPVTIVTCQHQRTIQTYRQHTAGSHKVRRLSRRFPLRPSRVIHRLPQVRGRRGRHR